MNTNRWHSLNSSIRYGHGASLAAQYALDALLLKLGVPLAQFGEDGRLKFNRTGGLMLRTPDYRSTQIASESILEIGAAYYRVLAPDFAARLPGSRIKQAEIMLSRATLSNYFQPVMHQDGWRPGIALSSVMGDFPSILADALAKAAVTSYAIARRTWRDVFIRAEARDFKPQKRIALTDLPLLPQQQEGEDITFFSLGDRGTEGGTLAKYSAGARLSMEAIISDDADVFKAIPTMFAQSAARLEDYLTFTMAIEANPVMADGENLFSTAHGNTTTGTLSVASIGSARAKMSRQQASDGSPLDIAGRVLLTPPELAITAEQLVASTYLASGQDDAPSSMPVGGKGKLGTTYSPFLSSTTQWYLATDPQAMPAGEVTFLARQPEPEVKTRIRFASGGMEIRCSHVVAAAPLNHRAIIRSSGA